jgi:HemY protein
MLLRLILVLLLSGSIAAATLWLVSNPGAISIDWMGWHAETTMLVLLLFVLSLLLLISVISSLFRFLFALGKWRSRALLARRVKDQEAGVAALVAALEAASAGEIREGRRLAGEASQLLQSRELARQLAVIMPLPAIEAEEPEMGNNTAGTASAEISRATGRRVAWWQRLLGAGARPAGGRLASRLPAPLSLSSPAPKADQAAVALDLENQTKANIASLDTARLAALVNAGDWDEAARLLQDASGSEGISAKDAARLNATMLQAKALTLEEADPSAALAAAKEALELQPLFLPAILLRARLLDQQGKSDEAILILKEAWRKHPAYPLLERSAVLTPQEAPETSLSRVEALVAGRAEHPEGNLALGEAAVRARAWGRARRHLMASAKAQPSSAAYALLAQIEEQEGGEASVVNRWRHKAEETGMDYGWHCQTCGTTLAAWMPSCPRCNSFGEIAWAYARKLMPPVSEGARESAAAAMDNVAISAAATADPDLSPQSA